MLLQYFFAIQNVKLKCLCNALSKLKIFIKNNFAISISCNHYRNSVTMNVTNLISIIIIEILSFIIYLLVIIQDEFLCLILKIKQFEIYILAYINNVTIK